MAFLSKVWPYLVAILFFGFIIASHELGHFSFAKLFKVTVNEFSLGMGPAIFKRKKNGTVYSLRLFPVGGFVSMEGEDEESQDENAFNRKKVWQRFIIVAAGAIMNLLLGLILVACVVSMDDLIGTNQILKFDANAISNQTGLQEKDVILSIDGHRVISDMDISFLMSRSGDGVFDMTVRRNGVKTELKDVTFETEIAPYTTPNGKPVTLIKYDFIILGKDTTPLNVVSEAFKRSASIIRLVWLSFFDLATGRYGISDLSGPVGTVSVIADATADALKTKENLQSALEMMALISINIGAFNLFPLPALDGGRLLFLFVEGIRRKPINPKYEGFIHGAGLVLLLGLMLVVTYNDIVMKIRGYM